MAAYDNEKVDSETRLSVQRFLTRLDAFPVGRVIVFGSRARGTFRADSDANVAALLQGPPWEFPETKLAMADVAYDVLLETGIRVQPLPIWKEQREHPERYLSRNLVSNNAREGLSIELAGCRARTESPLTQSISGDAMSETYEAIYDHGNIQWIGKAPEMARARLIITAFPEPTESGTAEKPRRRPPAELKGTMHVLGDIVSSGFSEEEWETMFKRSERQFLGDPDAPE